ncbi:helix-turn-helix transcriptional regulator [Candidatus Nitrotoga sp. AM1P]|uniref:helix-turn-helix transcriptional regulator n=1 Tax=Candidatus Nitrotoga sp. AM1P TaxID=2559597 RepID=UPI001563AE8A|nr:helix-turn-helix transcriptional regulator [Candidatus Nitrotoga sp. AM1P]
MPKMDFSDNINLIISDLYEGILDQQSQNKALHHLAQLLGSEHVALTTWNKPTNLTHIIQSSGLPEACTSAFQEHFYLLDPGRIFVKKISPGQWYIDHLHFGKKAMNCCEFYQDFMKPFGFCSLAVSPIVSNVESDSFIAIQYKNIPKSQKVDQLKQLSGLLAHLRRALNIQSHFESIKTQNSFFQASLEQIRLPILIASGDGSISYVSTLADTLLSRRTEIKMVAHSITSCDTFNRKLIYAIRLACGLNGPKIASGLRVGMNSNTALHLLITPLPIDHQCCYQTQQNMALIVIQELSSPTLPKKILLKQMYGMTLAEARVAIDLIKGMAPKEIAYEAGVAISTVRSQMKAIFSKTGASRQADLMRIFYPILSIDTR